MRRFVSGKWLRCGYTTGVCAAGAAKAAMIMLTSKRGVATVRVTTPNGHDLTLDVLDPALGPDWASCAVRKDGGDDPDATDGALIFARVEFDDTGEITIDGGVGIGRVTKPGLDQPVGAAAINSVPRHMIEQAVRETWDASSLDTPGLTVTISCPTGEAIAKKTFNPKLGIVGGISILGTTGIVEPMSNAALIETTAREISIQAATGLTDLVIVVGNYGQSFASTALGLDLTDRRPAPGPPTRGSAEPSADESTNSEATGSTTTSRSGADDRAYGWVKSSNFIGDAITSAAQSGFKRALVVGHLGKMSKLGIGMLDTHSSVGDGRIETLIACALEAGASLDLLHTLLDCVSTDAVVTALVEADMLDATMAVLGRRIESTFERRSPAEIGVEWICFTGVNGQFTTIAHSPGAFGLVEEWSRS